MTLKQALKRIEELERRVSELKTLAGTDRVIPLTPPTKPDPWIVRYFPEQCVTPALDA